MAFEEHDFVTDFLNDHATRLQRREKVDTPTAWEYLNSTERDVNLKTERSIELSQHES
jgi:hypothetical protein